MCGRYSNQSDGRRLVVRYKAANKGFEWHPNPNIAPTVTAPVVVEEEGQRVLKVMRWGLIPSWEKDLKKAIKPFNAKAETLLEKRMFSGLLAKRRCLVPADSFFEWRTEKEWERPPLTKREKADGVPPRKTRPIKVPYRFSVAGETIFSLAGLWTRWKGAAGEIESFIIITTTPNPRVAEYHNRMPVVLHPSQEVTWIDPEFSNPVLLQAMLKPFPAERMEIAGLNTEERETLRTRRT